MCHLSQGLSGWLLAASFAAVEVLVPKKSAQVTPHGGKTMMSKILQAMKKSLLFVSAIAAFAFSSCNVEEAPYQKPSEAEGSVPFELAASVTKTTIDADWNVAWENGDIIYAVTTDKEWGTPYAEDNTTESIAEFAYDGTGFTTEKTISDGTHTFNFIYSAGAQKSYHRGDATTNQLAATQTQDCSAPRANLKTYDALAAQAAGIATPAGVIDVEMDHLYTFMKVTLKNRTGADKTITSFNLKAAGAELAGVFTVSFAPVSITPKSSNPDNITVNLTNGTVASGADLDVYLVMAPLSGFTGDITLTATDSDGAVYTKTNSVSGVTFNAGEYNTANFTLKTAAKAFTWDLSIDETSEASASLLAWSGDNATMQVAKGSATTPTNNYYPGTSGQSYTSTRFYKNSILTIAPRAGVSISKIEFAATTASYASALNGSSWTNASSAVSGTTVTVTPTDGTAVVSASIGTTCGFTSVVVYYSGEAAPVPVITGVSDPSEVAVAGDVVTVSYSITNPAVGGAVTAVANASWVNTFDYSVDGEISFVVDENTGAARDCEVTVSYPGAENVKFTVSQAGVAGATWHDATMTNVTNGSAATVNSKTAVKVGTSSKGGDMTITVPAGASKIRFYAAAWNGVEGLSLNITPAENVATASVSLTADTGVSGNTPFTLNGSEGNYLFEINLSNVTAQTVFTLTSSIAKRFVVWGAQYYGE